MVGRIKKRSSTPKQTISTTVTGRRVKRRTETRPTKASEPRTATKPKKAVRTRTAIKPTKASKPLTAAKPKKAVKQRATAKPRAIRPATRATPRVTATAKKSVTFTLDAPSGWSVSIGGTFNNWEPQAMTKGPDARWRITLRLAPGTYEYKFLVDTEWREDPSNPRKRPNEHGGVNSICDVV
jgi:hypothetical protein